MFPLAQLDKVSSSLCVDYINGNIYIAIWFGTDYNIGNHYDGTWFTAPVKGLYQFRVHIFVTAYYALNISMNDSKKLK